MGMNSSGGLVAVARLFWMMLGPALLFLLAGIIAKNGNGWFAPASIAFVIILIGVIVARWSDPETGYGDPTTPADLPKFTVGTIVVGLITWLLANALGNHWLAS